MIHETLAILAGLGLLALIGIGPSLWLIGTSDKRLAYALGVAPALAAALLGIIGFPLVKYVAPAGLWSIPVTLILVGASVLLVFLFWRQQQRANVPLVAHRRAILGGTAFAVVISALLALPVLFNGIQYTIFRSNPSDSFYYMSLAETARTADWQTIQAGATPSPQNLEGMGALANVSPTSLLTARFTRPFAQLGMPTTLAWFAELVGLPIYRAFYPFHLMLLVCAALVTLVLADLLEIPTILKLLGAAAVAIGFWARFVLELNASGELASIPVLLLFVFAWIQVEREPLLLRSLPRVLLAIAAAALLCYYTPIVIVLAFAIVLYYAFALLVRRIPLKSLLYQGATLALVVLILVFTGQLDNIILTLRFLLFTNVAVQDRFAATNWEIIQTDKLAGLMGLPRTIMIDRPASFTTTILRRITDVLSLVPAVSIAVGAFLTFRKPTRIGDQFILALVASGLIIAGVMFLRENERTAGKAIGYIYPYIILGALLATGQIAALKNVWISRALVGLLSVWLGLQILWGTALPFLPPPEGFFSRAETFRTHNFNVQPIEAYLKQNPPRLLVVDVPRDKSWEYAFYSIFVFKDYPSYFQSGLVVDNSTTVQNLWFQEMPAAPDYAVMLREFDYLRDSPTAEPVAETSDLVLYHINTPDPSLFLQQEQAQRAAEMAKPFHQPAPQQ